MPSSQLMAREGAGVQPFSKPFRGTLRFELVRRLGRGGYGVVYEAFDHVLQQPCALKVLTRTGDVERRRFEQEFLALRELRHPNIVRSGELLEDDGRLFFTLDLVRGVQLLEHVRGGGRLDVARLCAVLGQLIDAVQAVHRAGKVHRDLKPANILVSHGGRLALLDFGLVTEVGAYQRTDVLAGTAAYMAPEQAMGGRVGPAADWYAVGAVLHEALTGRLPFEGSSFEILLAKQRQEPQPPRLLDATIPIELSALCVGLLKPDALWRLTGEEARALLGDHASAEPRARVA
jgi:serine/threonine protein kinase